MYKEELKKAGFRYKDKKWAYVAVDKDDMKRVLDLFQSNEEIKLSTDKWIY